MNAIKIVSYLNNLGLIIIVTFNFNYILIYNYDVIYIYTDELATSRKPKQKHIDNYFELEIVSISEFVSRQRLNLETESYSIFINAVRTSLS